MIIKELVISNFGPFLGKKIIRFGNEGEGTHLIRGRNGQGKTSIQRAILWGLYGEVQDRAGKTIRPSSLLNMAAKNRGMYDFLVNITLSHEEKTWIIHRKMNGLSNSNKGDSSETKLTLTIDGEVFPNPEHAIQRLIPLAVSKFFFFDGEMLNDYEELLYDSGVRTNLLRESIERVLGIPYIKNSREDAKAVQKVIENQRARLLRRLGGRTYEEILEHYDEIIKNISESEDNIMKMSSQVFSIDSEIVDRKRELANIESVRKLSAERSQLESDIHVLQANKEREQIKLNQISSQLYKVILKGTASNLISALQNKHEQVMSKYNEKQKLMGAREQITKGISDQKCRTCGTILDQQKMNDLNSQLEEIDIRIAELTEIPEPNLEFERYAITLSKLLDSSIDRNTLKEIENEIHKIDYDIATLSTKLSNVRDSLAGQDESEPKRIELRIRGLENEKGRLEGAIDSEKEAVKEFLEDKSELDKKIASIDQSELKTLANRIKTIGAIGNLFEKAIDIYRGQKKKEVETIANEVFKSLKTKESFERLEINNQFGLNIITKTGIKLDRGELRSSGEEQIVALSLIGALNRCAKIEAPVFMDTPFGRLDDEYAENTLRFIPKLAQQVTLLVTPREFRPGDEEFLDGQISSDFTLTYYGEEKGSEIRYTDGGDRNE